MNSENLLTHLKWHNFALLNETQSMLDLNVCEGLKHRRVETEVTDLTCVNVECDVLLGVLAHDLLEYGAMRFELALLLVYELSGEQPLGSSGAVVVAGLFGKLLSDEAPLTLNEK
jgi:hypothetical protein